MTCTATLADLGRVNCLTTTPHEPHRGCRFELTDQADRVHHEHDQEDHR